MKSVRNLLCLMLLASIPVSFGAADLRAAPAETAAGGPVAKTWEAEEYPCGWWISADDGTHGASINPGNDGVVLSMSDAAFLGWPDTHGLPIELSFNGHSDDRLKGEAWVTHVAGTPTAMASIELDAAGLTKLGKATNVMVFRNGEHVFAMDFAGTPEAEALVACIPDPNRGHGDAES